MKPDETPFEKSPITNEIDENAKKDLSDKQTAYVLLRKQGLGVQKASKLAGYHSRTGYILEKKLKKFDLTSDFWLKKSQKVLKNILDGKPWGEIKDVKASTALEGAKAVFDRAQPAIRKTENLNLNANIDVVDLSKYANKEPCEDVYDEGVNLP